MINIFLLPTFKKKVKQYNKKFKAIKKDLITLSEVLNENPTNSILIQENIYKVRLKNSNLQKGKSSGYRVYYFYKNSKNLIVLLYIYSKTEQTNLSDEDLKKLITELKEIFPKEIE